MKFSEINKRFTDLVTEYIGKGYTFNTASMGGSQGEIGKVDLTNGTEIIRIYVDSFSDWSHYYGLEGIEIVIGRNTDQVIPHNHNDFGTVWSSHLEILSRERFYKIGDDHKYGRLYGTLAEAEAAIEKRVARRKSRDRKREEFNPTPEMMAIAKRVVREKIGFKRICESDVKLIKSGNRYSVSYRGKIHYLH